MMPMQPSEQRNRRLSVAHLLTSTVKLKIGKQKLKSCPRWNVSASLILFCYADGFGGKNLQLSNMVLINSWCHTCFLPRGFGVATLSTEVLLRLFTPATKESKALVCSALIVCFLFGSSSCGKEQTVLELFLEAPSPHRFVVPVGRLL